MFTKYEVTVLGTVMMLAMRNGAYNKQHLDEVVLRVENNLIMSGHSIFVVRYKRAAKIVFHGHDVNDHIMITSTEEVQV